MLILTTFLFKLGVKVQKGTFEWMWFGFLGKASSAYAMNKAT